MGGTGSTSSSWAVARWAVPSPRSSWTIPGSGAAWRSSSATRRTGTRRRPSRRARSASSSRPPRTSACRGSASSSCATSRAGPDPVDVGLEERGYLYLAPPEGAATLREVHAVQRAEGAEVVLLDRAELAGRFPWMRFDDVEAGSLGLAGEGWFDGFGLLQALRQRALALGVEFVRDEVVGLDRGTGRIDAVRLASGQAARPRNGRQRRGPVGAPGRRDGRRRVAGRGPPTVRVRLRRPRVAPRLPARDRHVRRVVPTRGRVVHLRDVAPGRG